MANAARGKRILVAAALVGACSLVAVPAYGFYYVHNDELVATESKGAIEIVCTLDETASNGGVKTGVIMVPEGSTAGDCLKEAVVSSENQNGLEAIHDYSVSSLADDLSGKQRKVVKAFARRCRKQSSGAKKCKAKRFSLSDQIGIADPRD